MNKLTEKDFKEILNEYVEGDYTTVGFNEFDNFKQILTYDKETDCLEHVEGATYEEIFKKRYLRYFLDDLCYVLSIFISHKGLAAWIYENIEDKNCNYAKYCKYLDDYFQKYSDEECPLDYDSYFELYHGDFKRYSIYQLKRIPSTEELFFRDYDTVSKKFGKINPSNYRFIYCDNLNGQSLDDIFRKLNIDKPFGFRGHSLSVSDVIVLENDLSKKAYYVDSFGFKEIPEFIELRKKQADIIKDFLTAGDDYIASRASDLWEVISFNGKNEETAKEQFALDSMQKLLYYLYEKADEIEC